MFSRKQLTIVRSGIFTEDARAETGCSKRCKSGRWQHRRSILQKWRIGCGGSPGGDKGWSYPHGSIMKLIEIFYGLGVAGLCGNGRIGFLFPTSSQGEREKHRDQEKILPLIIHPVFQYCFYETAEEFSIVTFPVPRSCDYFHHSLPCIKGCSCPHPSLIFDFRSAKSAFHSLPRNLGEAIRTFF
jgi:hypothetical protein